MKRITFGITIISIVLIGTVLVSYRTTEGVVQISGDGGSDITITLEELDRSVLSSADTFLYHRNYQKAVKEYEKVLALDGVEPKVRAEARFSIGFANMKNGDYSEAKQQFENLKQEFSEYSKAQGYADYCLAWIEVQEEQPQAAIARLKRCLAENEFSDREIPARIMYKIGITYSQILGDFESGNAMLEQMAEKYPETKFVKWYTMDETE